MGKLGYRSIDELIGRADLLKPRSDNPHKTENLDLAFISQVRSHPRSHPGSHPAFPSRDLILDPILDPIMLTHPAIPS